MLALNDLYELGLSKRQLMKRGVRLGADIPYCILKGTALSEGIGEKISTIPKMPDCYVLICKPGIHVSTGFVYTNLVLDENTPHPDIDYMITCMKKKDLKTLCQNLGNVLETVTIPAHPEIAKIKETMMQEGALGSLMSGSGPTVFGIFDDLDKAKAAKAVCRKLPFKCFAFVTDLYR
ncbi:4-diphosphocytidyl-2-C-methyl-D-erythritol kinase [Clostridium sp. CAG:167]|nr:4-diphosphocytidyl-2-C-methyl-D-erythritol kinase [Clostridium sp. CAG:167]